MRERAAQEQLQPALLDRLADDEPGSKQESRERRVISPRKLRECVLRDLGWLLNSSNFESVEDLGPYDQVQTSVLNYGIPEFSGASASSLDAAAMEKALVRAIRTYEPRINPKSVRVRVRYDESKGLQHNAVTFDIEGELYAEPSPVRLTLKTDVDLETGDISVSEEFG